MGFGWGTALHTMWGPNLRPLPDPREPAGTVKPAVISLESGRLGLCKGGVPDALTGFGPAVVYPSGKHTGK